MATRTKSLVSAATLASAAAVAVAGTAIAPSVSLPTPHALSAAKVQLATFADVLSIPAVQWTDLLFGNTNWGNVLSSTNYGDASAQPQDAFLQPGYVNPWAVYCDGGCTQSGITGAAYLFFDALVNGNGQGWDNVDQWNTGIVNYFWEPNTVFVIGGGSSPSLQYVSEGWSAASWYLLQTTIGKAVPELTVPLAALYWGPQNLSVGYNAILTGVAQALNAFVPVVGPITGNSILAYLGDLEIPNSGGSYYQYGLSGTLNYWIDIATGSVPFPTATTLTTATSAAAVAAPAAAAPAAAKVEDTEGTEAEAGTEVSDTKDAPEVKGSESAGEESEAAEAPEVKVSESTEAPESTEASESTEAPEVKTVDASVVQDTPAAEAPAKPSRPRPVRDAVEKVSEKINSAVSDAKAKQAERAAARKAAKAAKAAKADSAG